ncbi:MAG TPA: lamin tail domain-containing protein, partial [Pyrinomonadaceae bacterium]
DPSQGSGTSGFLTKYTTDGNALWARVFGRADQEASDGDTLGYRVAVDAAGSPYVSGIFEGETTFGQESPATSQTLLSGETQDEFVAHYDAAGNFLWVKQPDESGGDVQGGFLSSDSPVEVVPMRLVYNDAAKAIILTGDFQGTLRLDDITLNSGDARHAYIATIAPPHPLVISEFRFRGPDPDGAGAQAGERDEFVELYNESNAEIDLAGWALAALDTNGTPAVVFNFPTGASVSPRGHYLLGGADYSLGVTPDGTLNFDIPDGSGIALFYVGTTLNASTRVDAAGFASVTDALYREGMGLTPGGGITQDGQHSFVRKQNTGTPQDTGNNENDFLFVSTNAAAYSGRVSALGAPGPENKASHVQRNAGLKASLVDPQCAGFGASNSGCARVRVGGAVPNGAYGTLALRRKFTNTTGAPVTALRFRVVDITTQNSPGFVSSHAILRVLSSGGATANGGTITITGATLEPTPAQPNGGGYNSALAVALPGGGLADGDSINVEFLLGVEQNGSFRFYVNVEAIPGTESASAGSPS